MADFASREGLIARQRRPARRLRRVLRTLGRAVGTGLVLAALGAGGIAAVHWLRTAPALAVARVEVAGLHRLPEATVLAAAGIARGVNLFAVDPEVVEDRVGALPGVRSARVVRHLPDRVVLLVEEREPYALVNASGAGGLVWIDADGRLVAPERRPGPPPLPILSGVEPVAAAADHPLADRLHAGLALLRALQRTGGRIAGRISEIDLEPADGPVLYTVDGVEVRVGHEGWDARLARLDGVLGELDERGERVESIDLRFRDLVVLRPRTVTPLPKGPCNNEIAKTRGSFSQPNVETPCSSNPDGRRAPSHAAP